MHHWSKQLLLLVISLGYTASPVTARNAVAVERSPTITMTYRESGVVMCSMFLSGYNLYPRITTNIGEETQSVQFVALVELPGSNIDRE